jgi:hypothetical protein
MMRVARCASFRIRDHEERRSDMQFDEPLRDELLADVKAIAPILVAFSTATPSRSWRG